MDDPKKLPTLDPKLQQAYERVMGFTPSASPNPTTPTPPQAAEAPTASPTSTTGSMPPLPSSAATMTQPSITLTPSPAAPTIPMQPTQPQPVQPQPTQPTQPQQPKQPTMQMQTGGQPAHGLVMGNKHMGGGGPKKLGGILPILMIFGGLVFFGIYTLFWVKFFNVSLPFLPK